MQQTRTALPTLVQLGVIAAAFFGFPKYARVHSGELGFWGLMAAILVLIFYANARVRYKVADES